ncbi:MAG: methyltransferase domain-containing protein [Bacteroidia bacterium]|nr:methyltransferase domain-containing protein [Bacteroidia bacterium]
MNESSSTQGLLPVHDLLPILKCPHCSGKLSLQSGKLYCISDDTEYPIHNNIPRFVPNEQYVGNFGFQWNKFSKVQIDNERSKESENFLRTALRLRPSDVQGKLVLDAGCGAGRYAEVLTRWGAKVVGVDLSNAVEAFHENLSGRNAWVLQADLLSLPFQDEVFDMAISIGVLHHTSDAKKAFGEVARTVKRGGLLLVWLYDKYSQVSTARRLSDIYRAILNRLPPRLLYALCHLAIPWYYFNKIPLLRSLTSRLWYISNHPNWRWRVLDTMDWYGCKYRSYHTYPEVYEWFQEAGFQDIGMSETPVAMWGQKAEQPAPRQSHR